MFTIILYNVLALLSWQLEVTEVQLGLAVVHTSVRHHSLVWWQHREVWQEQLPHVISSHKPQDETRPLEES